jgi:hypothetical protein
MAVNPSSEYLLRLAAAIVSIITPSSRHLSKGLIYVTDECGCDVPLLMMVDNNEKEFEPSGSIA